MKYSNSWHLLETDEVTRHLKTDQYRGLSSAEAKKRRRKSGSVWHVKHTTSAEIVKSTFFDLATLILAVTAILAAVFDRGYEAGAILGILILAGAVRSVVYIRSGKILEELAAEKIPMATVIRDGRIKIIPASEVVAGDIVYVSEGDTVPCDGRVIFGEDAVVLERGVTENSSPVHKFNTVIKTESGEGEVPCEFRSNIIFATSFVLSGYLKIVAVACGEDTLISVKSGGVEVKPTVKLRLIERLRLRGTATGLGMVAMVLVVTVLSMFTKTVTWTDVFIATLAAAVASMSEFVTTLGYIIVSVTLSEMKRGGKNRSDRVVMRDPDKLEDVAELDTIVFCGTSFFKSGKSTLSGYYSGGRYYDIPTEKRSLSRLIEIALCATSSGDGGISSGRDTVGRAGESATFVRSAKEAFLRLTGEDITPPSAVDHISASSEHSSGLDTSLTVESGDLIALSCGSVANVLSCCTEWEVDGAVVPMTDRDRDEIYRRAAVLENTGAGVMAVARRQSPFTDLSRIAVVNQRMTFVGFFAVDQEPEPLAAENLDYLRNIGAKIVIFSEKPEEDRSYVNRFCRNCEIQMTDLASFGAETLKDAPFCTVVSFRDSGQYLARGYKTAMERLCGTPKAPVKHDFTVAMLGREAWDAAALSRADVGYAAPRGDYNTVPESLARSSAAVIHSGAASSGFGGLSGLVSSVKSAKNATQNVESAKHYLTLSQIARVVPVILAAVVKLPLLSPVFLLLSGLLYDFCAVVSMAFDHKEELTAEKKRRGFVGRNILTLIGGLLAGAASVSTIPLARYIAMTVQTAPILSTGGERVLISVSMMLTGLVISAELMREKSLFLSHRINTASLVFAVATVGFCAFATLTKAGAFIIGGSPLGSYGAFALIPPLLSLIVCELYKCITSAIRKHKK